MLIILAWGITLLALLYGEENWRGRYAWRKFRQQLLAQGEQLDWQEFFPKRIPDEQNFAATPLIRAWFDHGFNWDDEFEAASHLVPKPQSREFTDLPAWQMAFDSWRTGKKKSGQKFQSGTLDSEARAKAAPAVLAGLKTSEPFLSELRAASQKPYARYPLNYDLENPWGILLPHLAKIKGSCSRLELKACAELAAGQSEPALADVKLTLYLADSIQEEIFLISYLTHLACIHLAIQPIWEGLAEHRWSDTQLQELQTRLQQYQLLSELKRPLGSERAAGILSIDLIRKKGLVLFMELEGPGNPTPSARWMAGLLSTIIPSGWYDLEQFNYCRLYQTELVGTFDPTRRRVLPREIRANSEKFEREITSGAAILHHRLIAGLLLPTLGRIPQKSAMAQTAVDQALLGCALERYRLANGQFPDKLEALASKFLSQLPNDLLSGEPYKYRRTPGAGFVLYSIGWNERDDGGVPGRTTLDDKGGDWVWEYPPKNKAVSNE
jgi:hypothetical protein